MKGVVFTLDVLLAIIILFLFFYSFTPQTSFSSRDIMLTQNTYLAGDVMNVLAYSKVKDNLDLPTVSSLFNKGVLSDENLNESMLELIGSLWFSGNRTIASNITSEFFSNLTGFCFSLQAENETIYTNCKTKGKLISVSSRLASGYEIGKPVFGYVARAWVTKVVKNTTEIIPFYPEGSGWEIDNGYGGPLEIKKKFYLPNSTILSGIFHFAFHVGKMPEEISMFEDIEINNHNITSEVIDGIVYQQCTTGFTSTCAIYSLVNITNYLKNGMNEVYIRMKNPQNYHTHVHPGMRIVVTYSITQESYTSNTTIRKRIYFDDVKGRSGAWSMLSFYLPENAMNVSAKLHLNLKNVEDTRIWFFDTYDIRVYVNSDTPIYSDASSGGCMWYVGYYCLRNIVSTNNITLDIDITPYIKNGTNTVSVFVNCYGDYHWGSDFAEIYSEPGDPESSYVELSYSVKNPEINYGEVDLTREYLFGGDASNPKDFLFNLTETSNKRTLETFVHIAQGFSSMTEAYANSNLVFESPAPRVVPENIYISRMYLQNGSNLIELKDVQPYGGLSATNYYLPWSSVEHRFIVKGIVGYGDVFGNLTDAINDAIDRLLKQVGEEQISTSNLQIDKKSVFGLRWFWGPSNFKVMVWEK